MINKIDDLIENNLNLLYKIPKQSMFYLEMIDETGNHFDRVSGKRFTDILINHGLITRDNERCDLTLKGAKICNTGGWKKFAQTLEASEKDDHQQKEYKSQLEIKNLELLNENAEYVKSIRAKEENIRLLTEENLLLQNRQLRRYILYSIIAFLAGAFLTNIKYLWNLIS